MRAERNREGQFSPQSENRQLQLAKLARGVHAESKRRDSLHRRMSACWLNASVAWLFARHYDELAFFSSFSSPRWLRRWEESSRPVRSSRRGSGWELWDAACPIC